MDGMEVMGGIELTFGAVVGGLIGADSRVLLVDISQGLELHVTLIAQMLVKAMAQCLSFIGGSFEILYLAPLTTTCCSRL